MKWLNLNQDINVKLKQQGVEVLKNKNIKLEPNDDGLYKLSLSKFMNIFGEYMIFKGVDENPYFEWYVELNEKDMLNDLAYKEYQNLCSILRNKRETTKWTIGVELIKK